MASRALVRSRPGPRSSPLQKGIDPPVRWRVADGDAGMACGGQCCLSDRSAVGSQFSGASVRIRTGRWQCGGPGWECRCGNPPARNSRERKDRFRLQCLQHGGLAPGWRGGGVPRFVALLRRRSYRDAASRSLEYSPADRVRRWDTRVGFLLCERLRERTQLRPALCHVAAAPGYGLSGRCAETGNASQHPASVQKTSSPHLPKRTRSPVCSSFW